MLSRANNDSGVVKLVGITYLLDKKLQIQLFSLRNKFSVKQTCIIRSWIISHAPTGNVYDWRQNYSTD